MSLLSKLEQWFGRFALPHLTLGLIVCQVVVYFFVIGQGGPEKENSVVQWLPLIPNRVLQGEVWRLVTFVAIPPFTNIIFAFFGWYLFYLMGTSLEHYWGTFHYNVFLFVGYVATVAVSFLTPDQPASAAFWAGSVFLAFAYLNPNFVIQLFFILPVHIKWLALLTWLGYGYVLAFGSWQSRFLVLASVCNFLLFFGKEILERMQVGRRHMSSQAAVFAAQGRKPEYYHRCTICGITDRTNPQMDFRYCSKCAGSPCYCADHLRNHEHIAPAEPAAEK